MADQTFPCDLLMLHAHSDDSNCHITTANLDGETNLKVYYLIIFHFKKLFFIFVIKAKSKPQNFPLLSSEKELSELRAVIKCDKPNVNLYDFTGKVIIDQNE